MIDFDKVEFKELVESLTIKLNEQLLPHQAPYTTAQIEAQLKNPFSLFLLAAAATVRKIILQHREETLHFKKLLDELENNTENMTERFKVGDIPPLLIEEEKLEKPSHIILDTIDEIQRELAAESHHLSDHFDHINQLHDDIIHDLHRMQEEDHALKKDQQEALQADIKEVLFADEHLTPDNAQKLNNHLDELHNKIWELGVKKAINEEKEEKTEEKEMKPSMAVLKPRHQLTLHDEIQLMGPLREMNKFRKTPLKIERLAHYARESLHPFVDGVRTHKMTQQHTMTQKLNTFTSETNKVNERLNNCAKRNIRVQGLIKQYETLHHGSIIVAKTKALHGATDTFPSLPSTKEYAHAVQHSAQKHGLKTTSAHHPIQKKSR